MVINSTLRSSGKKKAITVQTNETAKIPLNNCTAIPLKKSPATFRKNFPQPAKTGRRTTTENKIYSIKKDCLKISNLFYILIL